MPSKKDALNDYQSLKSGVFYFKETPGFNHWQVSIREHIGLADMSRFCRFLLTMEGLYDASAFRTAVLS